MKKTLLPAPWLSLLLAAIWLLLNPSWSVGNALLALLLGWAVPLLTARAVPGRDELSKRLRKRPPAPGTALRLMGVVLRDIVLSNVDVTRRLLGPPTARQSRFIWLPLALADPAAITTLACIITLTPGTVSCQLSPDRQRLLVHCLHCASDADAAALVADIQARYEQPLKEIFE